MAAKKKARRTTHRSSKGTKLYAVRDAKGRIKDIQTYKRAHGADLKRKSKAETGKKKAPAKAKAKAKVKAKAKAKAKVKVARAKVAKTKVAVRKAAKKAPSRASKRVATVSSRSWVGMAEIMSTPWAWSGCGL